MMSSTCLASSRSHPNFEPVSDRLTSLHVTGQRSAFYGSRTRRIESSPSPQSQHCHGSLRSWIEPPKPLSSSFYRGWVGPATGLSALIDNLRCYRAHLWAPLLLRNEFSLVNQAKNSISPSSPRMIELRLTFLNSFRLRLWWRDFLCSSLSSQMKN